MLMNNGFDVCEDKCKCGGNLRLHVYTFGLNTPSQKTKFYIDCDRYCGRVSQWHETQDEALEEFDNYK